MTDFDIIVVGAGVAGGVFAASQPTNRRILVVERDLSEQDRIVGELMQPGGILALEKLNLGHLLENIDAQEVQGYHLINGNQHFTIDYSEIEGGKNGLGLRNGKFLSNIRKQLEQSENISLVQGNVTELIEENGKVVGVNFTNSQGEKVSKFAHLTIVCDGPMSMLRNKLSKTNKKVFSYFIGLILYDLKLDFPKYGQMILTGDSPILVYPTHENAYRILIDYPGNKAPRMGEKSLEKLKDDVVNILPEEMRESFLKAMKEEQLKVMPNHSMKGQVFRKNGVVLLGDSLNMRHPLTGGGMTAVFSDILCLNEQLKTIDFKDENKLQLAADNYYNNRHKGVESINILADALYQVFIDKDLKESCFEYLKSGGEQATGPLSILSGINKNKNYLLKHFYKLTIQHPMHFFTQPQKQIRIYRNAARIIRQTLKEEERSTIL